MAPLELPVGVFQTKNSIAFEQNLFAGNKLHNWKGGGQIFVEATQVLLMSTTMMMPMRMRARMTTIY